MPQPNKIPLAFAASGDKNAIPENTETTGLASWRNGFPAITSAPFSEGGIAPKRADFNGIFNALSLATLWQQQGGFYAYDATTDYEVGNVIEYGDDLYKCITANGPSSSLKAPTDTTVWSKVMTAADAAAYLLLAGGTMTGAIVSTVDTILKKSTTTGSLIVLSGTNENSVSGANIVLRGGEHASNPGEFTIHAGNGNGYKQLIGKPDGTLTWGGNDIFTSGNCAISSSTTTIPYSFKQKFANGFMIQAYYGKPNTDSNSRFQWTYPEAFIEDPFVSVSNAIPSQALNLAQWNKTRTIVNVCNTTGEQAGANVAAEMIIIAFGRWE